MYAVLIDELPPWSDTDSALTYKKKKRPVIRLPFIIDETRSF